jgi:hypothetical protein
MTDLETEIQNLRKQLDDVAERVRLDAVAKEFLAKKVEYREGDVIRRNGHVEQIHTISPPEDTGKSYVRWGVTGSHGRSYEAPAPDLEAIERFYTHAEVAEIVAKATMGMHELAAAAAHAMAVTAGTPPAARVGPDNPTLVRMVRALEDISHSTNPEYTIRRAREALGL